MYDRRRKNAYVTHERRAIPHVYDDYQIVSSSNDSGSVLGVLAAEAVEAIIDSSPTIDAMPTDTFNGFDGGDTGGGGAGGSW